MKVLVVGITGRIGKRVARLLLERGHEVIGVNRRAERVPVIWNGQPPFETLTLDALDAGALAAAVKGTDAVVFASTPTREAPTEYLQQNRNLIAAVRGAGEASGLRIVALSGTYALNAPDGRPMLEVSPPNPYFLELESVFAKVTALYQTDAADLDWLLIAPAAETYPYGETTGEYRVAEGQIVVTDPASLAFKETSKISMEDVAHLVVAELEQPTRHNALISLGY
jgi:putative NADH-flavin reductase